MCAVARSGFVTCAAGQQVQRGRCRRGANAAAPLPDCGFRGVDDWLLRLRGAQVQAAGRPLLTWVNSALPPARTVDGVIPLLLPGFRRRHACVAALLALLLGCSTVRVDMPRPASHALPPGVETSLGRAYAAPFPATGATSGVRLLVSGTDAFVARAALAEAAQRTLDLQYYVVAPDATATLLLYRALLAAQRGVRVRLLLDDIGAAGRDSDLAALAAHPNVQIRIFNPFLRRGGLGISRLFEFIGDSARLNRRMHNKLWIADNAVAVIGGRNLGDAYFAAQGEGDFADLDVLAAGPVVAQASTSFDDYWNSEWAVPIGAFVDTSPARSDWDDALAAFAAHAARFRDTQYAHGLRASDFGRAVLEGRLALIAAPAGAVYDPPGKLDASTPAAETGRIFAALRPRVESAQHELILVSPYFIPSSRGIAMLCALVQRGVAVRVLTNSLASTDVPAVHSGYARYRPRLLACGVQMHEFQPAAGRGLRARTGLSSGASLHAKAILVDRQHAVIGSMNLDPRSRLSNTEIAVTIDSAELGAQLGALFDEATAPGQAYRVALSEPGNAESDLVWHGGEAGAPVRHADEPNASWWRRLIADLFAAFGSEEWL
jgi:cardiolipin synthase C